MRRIPLTWPLLGVDARRKQIDPSPPYQRGLVWSRSRKQTFIDSMLRDFDIPKLYLRRIANNKDSQYTWEVVDGQQRLNAIWQFLNNEYPISEIADPVEGHQISDKIFDNLDPDVQVRLQTYELNIIELEDADDQEIEEMFLRLQDGVPLNAAEKRNAISGKVRDFVQKIVSSSKLFTTSLDVVNNRFAHHEIATQMLLIELNGGPTLITPAKLVNLYKAGNAFNESSTQVKKFKSVLNFLARSFPKQSGQLTKTNAISLYTVASESLAKYAISKRAKDFGKWFVEFEKRRDDEQDKPEDEMDPQMREYQLAILQGSRSVASQQDRRRVLLEDLLRSMPDLPQLDDQRIFTSEQRAAIFRKSNGKCVNPNNNRECSGECSWDNFHADHIVPYSAGGKTIVSNGQLLCPSCNLKKSDKNLETQ